jgi:ubiquitin-like-conjugating enzyme ATG3
LFTSARHGSNFTVHGRWEEGKKKLKNKNLPSNKQFLITKSVPCPRRATDVDKGHTEERELENDWVETTITSSSKGKGEEPGIIDIDADEDVEEKKEKEPVDINDDDADVFEEIKAPTELETIKTRTYDISITYDFYYRTPRLWLFGYNEKGAPLTEKEMFEDIMSDYANKTVTIESHPHQGVNCLSVHPCKHAFAMKKIIDMMSDNGSKAEVYQAMFVFLKFISSVIPTIEYDYTLDMNLE